MSAINIAISEKDQLAVILCDSAAYSLMGKIVWFVPKLRTLPHARAVVTGRGNSMCLNRLYGKLSRCSDFDQMAGVLQDKCRRDLFIAAGRAVNWALSALRVRQSLFRWREAKSFNPIEIVLVGFSARDGDITPRIKAVSWSNCGPTPFKLVEGPAFTMPGVTEDEMAKLDLSPEVTSWHGNLLRIMEYQRERALQQRYGEIIGGAAILTKLTLNGVNQVVLKRWPDKIGDQKGRRAALQEQDCGVALAAALFSGKPG